MIVEDNGEEELVCIFTIFPAVYGLIRTEDPQIVKKSYIAGERHLFFKRLTALMQSRNAIKHILTLGLIITA